MKQRHEAASFQTFSSVENDVLPPVHEPPLTAAPMGSQAFTCLRLQGLGHLSNHCNEKLTALYLLFHLGLECRERVLSGNAFLF